MKTVGFIGAPGSGKSTTALGLAHLLKANHFVTDYVPEYAREYFSVNGIDNISQVFIQDRSMKIIHSFQKNKNDFLVVDTAHYCNWLYGERCPKLEIKYPINYDMLFYVRPAMAAPDNLRMHDYDTAMKLDEKLVSMMKAFKTNIVDLSQVEWDDRAFQAFSNCMKLIS